MVRTLYGEEGFPYKVSTAKYGFSEPRSTKNEIPTTEQKCQSCDAVRLLKPWKFNILHTNAVISVTRREYFSKTRQFQWAQHWWKRLWETIIKY